MAVVKQKPLINDTVLQLAEEAAVGDVFIYSNNEYQWTPRSEAWTGVMLTKTERGFELIDKNGRSHGIVNLGEPYHNVDPTPACTACDKAYVWQNAVAEITAVCCDQELYVGNCAEQGWQVDWCEFPEPETMNTPTVRLVVVEIDLGLVIQSITSVEPQEQFPIGLVEYQMEATQNGETTTYDLSIEPPPDFPENELPVLVAQYDTENPTIVRLRVRTVSLPNKSEWSEWAELIVG